MRTGPTSMYCPPGEATPGLFPISLRLPFLFFPNSSSIAW
jgi:hypothetical protein